MVILPLANCNPDLTVVCDKEKLTDKGCKGAPDWVVEITSENNFKRDYVTKMIQYQKSGVREYWIIDPAEKKVSVFNFENSGRTDEYSFTDEVTSGILDGLTIKMSDFDCQF